MAGVNRRSNPNLTLKVRDLYWKDGALFIETRRGVVRFEGAVFVDYTVDYGDSPSVIVEEIPIEFVKVKIKE